MFAAVLATAGLTGNAAFAQDQWAAKPQQAQLTGINARGTVQPNATIYVPKGALVRLSAESYDIDTRTLASGGTEEGQDEGWVNWTKIGPGTLPQTRTKNFEETLYTAPNEIATVTITAQADDKPLLADDNDGSKQTITIEVVDAESFGGPTGVSLVQQCSVTPSTDLNVQPNWSQYDAFGYLTTKMRVTGGNPPSPPGNWNGLYITEVVTLNVVYTTAVADDFADGTTPGDCCHGDSGFVVGAEWPTEWGCVRQAEDNCFWDRHSSYAGKLKEGRGPVDVVCKQDYFWGPTKLATFSVRRRFENIQVFNPPQTKTKITVTKE
ncbi:MAG: hypothetical protein HYS13_10125 [Planctomycetia bacterium]|nr:hypothetical protein [Planctomycetia bacterium]